MSTAEIERLMERLGVNSALAEQKRLMDSPGMKSMLAEQKRLMDSPGMKSMLAEQKRLMDSPWMKSALAEVRPNRAELPVLEPSETSEALTTAEERELAAEVQICAIELLALQIEDDLPDWLKTNRKVLAWNLAVAAHNFIIGLMRAIGRTPELYTPNSSVLNSLFMLLLRR